MKWTRKHQNPTIASANFVFRSSANKDKKPLKQKSNASEGFNSAVKHENVVSKVVVMKKQLRKHRRDSHLNGSEMPADVSVSNSRTNGWQALDQSEGNARRHENVTITDSLATSDKITYTTSNFVFRDNVSKDEQDLNVI